MFEVGFQEIVLIALLALVVLGPEKLPKLAAQLGRWTGRARAMARNLRQQLEQEVSYEDLLKEKQAAEEALRKATSAPMDFHINDPLQEPAVTAPAPAIEAHADKPAPSVAPAPVSQIATASEEPHK